MADFPYSIEKRLVIIPVKLYGKSRQFAGEFVLDTGASLMVVDHSVINALGYSAREGVGLSVVSSVVGKERGYRLVIDGFEALGKRVTSLEVTVHDLKEQGVEGLVGMSFLDQFRWCLDPSRKNISVT